MASCGNLLFVNACQIAGIETRNVATQRLGEEAARARRWKRKLAAMQQPDAPSLPLSSIRVDWTINARAAMRRETALEYADALKAGAKFPPVTVFFDGSTYWLADGFHRYVAYEIAGMAAIPVEIRLGTPRAAALYGAAANGLHGLRPTRSDRRKAIIRLLRDPEWTRWSNQKIAVLCGAEPDTVSELRRTLDRVMATHPADELPPAGARPEERPLPQMAG